MKDMVLLIYGFVLVVNAYVCKAVLLSVSYYNICFLEM
jgi:hypothetical protein